MYFKLINAIYHLHIPRTSGIFIKRTIAEYSEINKKKMLSGHDFKIEKEDFKDKIDDDPKASAHNSIVYTL